MMRPVSCMLSSAPGSAMWNLAIGALLVIAIVAIGGVAIHVVRRKFHPSSRREDGTLAGGFSMSRLEALRRAGEISDEEFRILRRAALGLGPGSPKTADSASSAPRGGDDSTGVARPDEPCAE